MNPEQLSAEQLDRVIKALNDRRDYKVKLMKQYQAEIDSHYELPVKKQGLAPKMDIKTFWTKDIKGIIYYMWEDAPICFCCTERSIFEVEDAYSKYKLCYSCGKEVIARTGFSITEIEMEF